MPTMFTTQFSISEQFAAVSGGSVVCAPNDISLIRVTGDDAATFLHSLLTNAVEDLGLGEARLAGMCSPKGRLQATMMMWRDNEGLLLQVPADIAPGLQKRLTMFKLRAKVMLSSADEVLRVFGTAGPDASKSLAAFGLELPASVWGVTHQPNGTVIRLPDAADRERYQVILAHEQASDAWKVLSATLLPVDTEVWNWLHVQSGIPRIVTATQEQFVPQMINFEVVGGVNFRKGCYPGQEVVARSQYRGTLKRRMFLGHVALEGLDVPAPGTELFSEADAGQPCGMVVNAAGAPDGGSHVLAELKLDTVDTLVHVGSATGPTLTLVAQPYALPVAES
ncbi:folate-binding protein YgfZ [Imbroritus primus]|uniref:Folate-binding protein YgfZ n=1 Tax=Imbroritus primus TaxID=3058603 RepID=A0ACD3SRN3_9BURK|nr:folate-binding protein YgfZ [Burkholderiaceae bacterium PBA]